nr:MAG TPA: hypothetical protein [Caudoviricetes sp.]
MSNVAMFDCSELVIPSALLISVKLWHIIKYNS